MDKLLASQRNSAITSRNFSQLPLVLHSLPWILGWISLLVAGPMLFFKILYKSCKSILQNYHSYESFLRGKVVVITGASSGLGEALAHAFYRHGCRLILASRNIHKLTELKEALIKNYSPVELHVPVIISLDLEKLNQIPEGAERILSAYGYVDIVINNAGVSYRGAIEDTELQVDVKLMVVNYFGQVALTKALLPSMIRRKSGHIIGIGSVQSYIALPFRSCYSASKHAFLAFLDSLRTEVSKYNIKVTVFSPGYIATNLSKNAYTGNGVTYGKTDETTASGMLASDVAKKIIACTYSQETEVLMCPVHHRFALLLRFLLPSLLWKILIWRAHKNTSHEREKLD